MTMIDIYFGIATLAVLIIGIAIVVFRIKRKQQKEESIEMPNTEGDPLFEAYTAKSLADAPIGRWGDQIIGKPKIITTETQEERLARLHKEAEQLRTQQELSQARQPTSYVPSTLQTETPKQNIHHSPRRNTQETTLIVLYVMAADNRRFAGYELYQSLINTGLIYGKMHIFHYHEYRNSDAPILFSVASALNPGSIDVEHIGRFSTPGLTLFLDASRVPDAKIAFETMVAVAEQLADDLHGTVLNSKREPWSTATEAECYAKL